MNFSVEPYKSEILKKLNADLDGYSGRFKENAKQVGTNFIAIDDLLPAELALEIHRSFPKDLSVWREMKTFRERKLTSKNFAEMPKMLGDITFAIQDPDVLKCVEKITGIKNQHADPTLYAGGLSMMRKGDFLNPHIDNSHNHTRTMYRRINLLYYVTPDWKLEDGGHLELWDQKVHRGITIESRFNRLVLMETNHTSWHSVSKVKKDGLRCCVSNYYFSPDSPLEHDYFHVTSFKGRPDEPMKRLLSDVDSFLRMSVRRVLKDGLGKDDLYSANRKAS